MNPQQPQPEVPHTLPPPVSYPQPPVPHRSKTLHTVVMVLIAIILIGSGVALGLYLKSNSTGNQDNKNAVSIEDVNKPNPEQTKADDQQAAQQTAKVLAGVQKRARDTERQTDINSIATQLEVYYNNYGGYPVLKGQLDNDTWVAANLTGIDITVMRPPLVGSNAMTNTATPTTNQYGYQAFMDDNVTACTQEPCTHFRLYWLREDDNKLQTKESLN